MPGPGGVQCRCMGDHASRKLSVSSSLLGTTRGMYANPLPARSAVFSGGGCEVRHSFLIPGRVWTPLGVPWSLRGTLTLNFVTAWSPQRDPFDRCSGQQIAPSASGRRLADVAATWIAALRTGLAAPPPPRAERATHDRKSRYKETQSNCRAWCDHTSDRGFGNVRPARCALPEFVPQQASHHVCVVGARACPSDGPPKPLADAMPVSPDCRSPIAACIKYGSRIRRGDSRIGWARARNR
jgi:hypothetical protein